MVDSLGLPSGVQGLHPIEDIGPPDLLVFREHRGGPPLPGIAFGIGTAQPATAEYEGIDGH